MISQPAMLNSPGLIIDNSVINAVTTYTFSFSYPNLVEAGSSIEMIFPNEITFDASNSSTSIIF